MEHGADVFVTHQPYARALCEELGLQLQHPTVSKAYLRGEEGLGRLPEGFSGLVPSRIGAVLRSPRLSLRGKMRLLCEPLVPAAKGRQDESVKAFFVRRYGHEAYRQMIEPLMKGLSGGDPEMLSMIAMLPHLREKEQRTGRLLGGMLRSRRLGQNPLASLSGGLGTLVDALSTALHSVDIHTEWRARSVKCYHSGYELKSEDGQVCRASKVIVTVPAFVGATILKTIDQGIAELLGKIKYGTAVVVHLGFPSSSLQRKLDATGYIARGSTGEGVMAVTWSSAKFSGRAPDGYVLVRAILGRKGTFNPLVTSDEKVIAIARDEMQEILGIRVPPVLTRVCRWAQSVPRYELGHPERCKEIEERLQKYPGLFLAGAAYHGAGIPRCIKDGQRAGEALINGA